MTNQRSPWAVKNQVHWGDYYNNFLNSKVKLTEIGLYILESIKGGQYGQKSSMVPEYPSSDPDPRHVSDIN
jgi:hypothetical protein